MSIEQLIREKSVEAVEKLFGQKISADSLTINQTNKEFEGDLTVVVFPVSKIARKSPQDTATAIGNYLMENSSDVIARFNVVQGFLNLVIADSVWIQLLKENFSNKNFGFQPSSGKTIVFEYCGPNTNKPLHLGHIRNMVLGFSVSEILKAAGYHVVKANIYNDRGISICRSMLAWLKFGIGETPESTGIKGDHLVGKYYVRFEQEYRKQVDELMEKGVNKEDAEKQASLKKEIEEMLRQWEAGDAETISLWKKMNAWVYSGFNTTYKKLGVDFEKDYFESNTYLKGKDVVMQGLERGIFFKKEDGSVWVDLTADGLDQKVLLRGDGTSVYITQDIGTAIERFKDFPDLDRLVYTVGNEQDYHFKVLFLVLKKLGYVWAANCFHLSYGMVDLPSGKMKSREGTVVDADDLIDEMFQEAEDNTKAQGKIETLSDAEAKELFRKLGLGALKYFILRVDPKKRIMFDPKESIDFHGHTGPFVQYTFARINSVLNRATFDAAFSAQHNASSRSEATMTVEEREVMVALNEYPNVILEAAKTYDPSHVANYVYHLAKSYNHFYQEHPILKADEDTKKFRLMLSRMTANVISSAMMLLGIEVPERM